MSRRVPREPRVFFSFPTVPPPPTLSKLFPWLALLFVNSRRVLSFLVNPSSGIHSLFLSPRCNFTAASFPPIISNLDWKQPRPLRRYLNSAPSNEPSRSDLRFNHFAYKTSFSSLPLSTVFFSTRFSFGPGQIINHNCGTRALFLNVRRFSRISPKRVG